MTLDLGQPLDAILQQAVDLYQAGEYQSTLDCIKRLLDAEYPHPRVYHIAAAAWLAMQNLDKAEYYWQQALRFDPDFAPAYTAGGFL